MQKYIREFRNGERSMARVHQINRELLAPEMPVVRYGVLYLDGEGTATAAVAKHGAELFNEGAYDRVVMAGARRPWLDPKSIAVFPKVRQDGLPLPNILAREAHYMRDAFARFADPEKFQEYSRQRRIHVITRGTNAGAKARACASHFNEIGLVQCVTLAYSVKRLVGTIAKESNPGLAVTGERVYPFGITKDNWHQWYLSYAVVIEEADKTGPRLDGKPPAYANFFDDVDLHKMGEDARKSDAWALAVERALDDWEP